MMFQEEPRTMNSNVEIASLMLEVTNACDLACPTCLPLLTRQPAFLIPATVPWILDRIPSSIKRITLHFRGEPFLHPYLPQIIGMVKKRGFRLVASTNGMQEPRRYVEALAAGLDKLTFTLDGLTKDSIGHFRYGSRYDAIIQSLTEAANSKNTEQKVGVVLLTTQQNSTEDEFIPLLAAELGLDFVKRKSISLNLVPTHKYANRLKKLSRFLPTDSPVTRYENEPSGPVILTEDTCDSVTEPVITVGGEVLICCGDFECLHAIGVLSEEHDFTKIWNSQHSKVVRRKGHNRTLGICRQCQYNREALKKLWPVKTSLEDVLQQLGYMDVYRRHSDYWNARRELERVSGHDVAKRLRLKRQWEKQLRPFLDARFVTGNQVLDFGGGRGRFAPLLEALGLRYVCADSCHDEIKRAESEGCDTLFLENNWWQGLEIPYGFSVAVFCHLENEDAVEILKHLRQVVTNSMLLFELVGTYDRKYCYSVPNTISPPTLTRPLLEWKNLFEQSGWVLEREQFIGRKNYCCLELLPYLEASEQHSEP